MKCPTCQIELKMTDRQGVEIDYCPQCRGVWLDRGELDKIIERTSGECSPSTPFRSRQKSDDRDDLYDRRWDDDDYERDLPRGRRRRSFLGELFDFD
jgi:Zn-finger nucleic acid-binding protein